MAQSFESWYVQQRARQQNEILTALHALRDELHAMNEDLARGLGTAPGRAGDVVPDKDAPSLSDAPREPAGAVCGEVRE